MGSEPRGLQLAHHTDAGAERPGAVVHELPRILAGFLVDDEDDARKLREAVLEIVGDHELEQCTCLAVAIRSLRYRSTDEPLDQFGLALLGDDLGAGAVGESDEANSLDFFTAFIN